MNFVSLGLCEPILRAVSTDGYTTPTPIQLKAIPHVLKGEDLLGCAQTGTGKTAAFALPILHRLADGAKPGSRSHLRALILAPTRELAAQIGESVRAYGRNLRLRHTVIFGGVNQHHQVRALKAGVDILIATPGRLLDLMQQGHVDLRGIEIFVLDEADRMLDMGFIPDIRKIVKVIPQKRQTLMFSATMPGDIRQLAASILNKPVSVAVDPVASTVLAITQQVYFVNRSDKAALLTHLLKANGMGRTLVFTRTKHGADKVVKHLDRAGIRAAAIHGNKSQNNRTRALAEFKTHKPPVLVATDIASRGIDVDEITHVINFDIPNIPETYVHRIGRTARAGASGIAISFCDREERGDLKAIERLTQQPIAVNNDRPQFAPSAPMANDRTEESNDRSDRTDRRWSRRSNDAKGGGHAPRNSGSRRASGPKNERSSGHHAGHSSHASKPAHAKSKASPSSDRTEAAPKRRGLQNNGRGRQQRGRGW